MHAPPLDIRKSFWFDLHSLSQILMCYETRIHLVTLWQCHPQDASFFFCQYVSYCFIPYSLTNWKGEIYPKYWLAVFIFYFPKYRIYVIEKRTSLEIRWKDWRFKVQSPPSPPERTLVQSHWFRRGSVKVAAHCRNQFFSIILSLVNGSPSPTFSQMDTSLKLFVPLFTPRKLH